MNDLNEELAQYIKTLLASAAKTNRSEDRIAYKQHLAAAAEFFVLLQTTKDRLRLDNWATEERRRFGTGFLSGDAGKQAELAFHRFCKSFEKNF